MSQHHVATLVISQRMKTNICVHSACSVFWFTFHTSNTPFCYAFQNEAKLEYLQFYVILDAIVKLGQISAASIICNCIILCQCSVVMIPFLKSTNRSLRWRKSDQWLQPNFYLFLGFQPWLLFIQFTTP